MRVTFLTYRKRSNVRALTEAGGLALRLVDVHQDGLTRYFAVYQQAPKATNEATLLTAAHGFNLFVAAMDLLHRGRFDVAYYLYRPLRDLHSIVMDVGTDEVRAKALMDDTQDFRAGDSRKLIVERLRKQRPEWADDMDSALRSEHDVYQTTAHVGGVHLAKLVQPARRKLPDISLSGVNDGAQALQMSRGFLRDEMTLLMAFATVFPDASSDWNRRVSELVHETTAWLQRTA